MKAEILKIAGVKDEASFYKKFPTEEAFMAKHGEQFKKAQQGKKLSLKSSKLKLIEDNEGYRNPANYGYPVSIDQSSPNSYIDMKGINQSLLALSGNEVRLMHPGEQHKFKGKKVVEFPIAQKGKDIYFNDIEANIKNTSRNRTSYDPRLNNINLGKDYDKFSTKEKGEVIAHENYHAKQHKDKRDNFDIAHNTNNAQWMQMQKLPEVMSTDAVYNNFYNRKSQEIGIDLNSLKNNRPDLQFISDDAIYDRVIDGMQYDNPTSLEGEAEQYQYTGKGFKKAQQGTNILPIDISQKSDSLSPVFNTKKIVNYQPGVSNSKMGSGFYLYSRNQSEPGFNPERDREFVKQTEMEAVQRTPQWREFMQSKKPIIDNIVSMEDGGYIPIAQEGTMMGPSNQSNNFYQNNNPYFTTNPGATSINNPAIGLDTTVPTNPKAGFSDYLGAAGSIVSGFDMLGQEKTKRREAKQARELSEVLLKASNSTDIDALRPKQYVRPEDNPTQPNQLFPTNGVGTNVLAKNGKNIPTYHDYEDFTIAQNGANFLNSVNPGDITALTSLASTGFGNNGGSQIGGGFGQIAGMATGYPGASELVKLGGTVIGGLFGDNGSAARDQKTAQRNYDMIAANQMNKDMQATNRAFMQDGGVMPISDELETHWGGYQEEISENPYLPNDGKTVMFRGQSHDDGGIGVTYGNNPVEVEGGEPAVVIPNSQGEENLTVFGNLNIPEQFAKVIGDDKAKGMKFKNYIAQLSKKEEKHSSSLKKSTQEIDTLDMTTPYDKLKFSTLQANILGQNMSLKEIADKKQKASELQAMLNDTAEQHGLSAEHLSKGKIKQAKTGMNIAQNGKNIFKNIATTPGKIDYNTPEQSDAIFQGANYEKQWMPKVFKTLDNPTQAKRLISSIENYNGQDAKDVKAALAKGKTEAEKIEIIKTLATDRKIGPYHNLNTINTAIDSLDDGLTPIQYSPKKGQPADTSKKENYETVPYKRSKLMDAYNMVLPFIRPTDQEPLDPRQLTGEMYSLATNRVEPVQAQTIQQDLATPIDISYQDLLNQNQSDFRDLIRNSNNPAYESFAAAQKYEANQKVYGDQFRAKQISDNNVYNQNRNTMNDTKLKNLGIFDQQYTRQEQAKSNTKAIAQAALNSMSDKYTRNRLENKTLGIQENMYNYRFDDKGRAINYNPLFQANEHNIYSPNANEPITQVPVKDANGKIVGYQQVGGNSDNTGTQASIQTTTETTTKTPYSFYKPMQPGEGVDTSVGTYKNGGKVSKKKYTNGSIVSSMKRC